MKVRHILLLLTSLILFSCGGEVKEEFIAQKIGLDKLKKDFEVIHFSYDLEEDEEEARENEASGGFYNINFKISLKPKADRYQHSAELREEVVQAFNNMGFRFYPPKSKNYGRTNRQFPKNSCVKKLYSQDEEIALEGKITAVHYKAEAEAVLKRLNGEALAEFEKELERHRKDVNKDYGGDIELKGVYYSKALEHSIALSEIENPILAADSKDKGFASILQKFKSAQSAREKQIAQAKAEKEAKAQAEKDKRENYRIFLSQKNFVGSLSYQRVYQKVKIEGFQENKNFGLQKIKISFIDDPKHYYEFEGKSEVYFASFGRYYYVEYRGSLKAAQLAKNPNDSLIKNIVDQVKRHKADTDIYLKFRSDSSEITGYFDYASFKINVKEMK